MNLPTYVAVAHRTFKVIELDEDLRSCVNDDGLIDFESDSITINTAISEAQVVETLLHEIAHAVNAVANVNDHTSEEESVTRTIPIWMCVFRDNQKLVDLLCDWIESDCS